MSGPTATRADECGRMRTRMENIRPFSILRARLRTRMDGSHRSQEPCIVRSTDQAHSFDSRARARGGPEGPIGRVDTFRTVADHENGGSTRRSP
jgi:hypothetical protein